LLKLPIENSRKQKSCSSDASVIRKSRIPINSSRSSSSKSAPQSPQSNKVRTQSQIPCLQNGSSYTQNQQQSQPNNKARFEAYMMTGDLILNLSRTPQVPGFKTPLKVQKIDSLYDAIGTAPQAKYDSSPSSSSPSLSEDVVAESEIKTMNSYNDNKLGKVNSGKDSDKNFSNSKNNEIFDGNPESNFVDTAKRSDQNNFSINRSGSESSSSNSSPNNNIHTYNIHENSFSEFKKLIDNEDTMDTTDYMSGYKNQQEIIKQNYSLLTEKYQNDCQLTPSASVSSTSTSSVSTTINKSETLNTPSLDVSYSMPTSPTSLTTPLLVSTVKKKEISCSVPTSPETGQQEFIKRSQSNNSQHHASVNVKRCDASGFRTSRSEDLLQNSQREGFGTAIPIDIDEDVNSSLNTLLDTRQDSEDSQVVNLVGN
jgi:PH/SEC7 domain-containing protein